MNAVDALLLVLVAPFALRGYFRGFCRETFGLAGLVGGVVAAGAGGGPLGAALAARHLVPEVAAAPAAAALIVLAAVVVGNLLGRLADRLARALLLGGLDRLAGTAFGLAKGATALGLGLLVAERLFPASRVARLITTSVLGRPLVELAAWVVETGRGFTAPAGGRA